jgi:hypothetical protein
MTRHSRWAASFVILTAVGFTLGGDAQADSPAPFGPVDSRAFAVKGGSNIEKVPTTGCSNNSDWLVIHGANLSTVKSFDVAPTVWTMKHKTIPSANTCAKGDLNCTQLFVMLTSQDALGTRTVTLTAPDGRKLTTTFDVIPNAGRCDYAK